MSNIIINAILYKDEVSLRAFILEHFKKIFTNNLNNFTLENLKEGTNIIIEFLMNDKYIREIMKYNIDLAYHSLNVGIYSYFYALKESFTPSVIKEIVKCGLYHDIGMLYIEEELNFIDNYEEKDFLASHTIQGYEFIKNKNVSNNIKYVILNHHERIDGSGFPIGKEENSYFSQIIGLIDTFDINFYKIKDFNKTIKIIKKEKINQEVIDSFINSIKLLFF